MKFLIYTFLVAFIAVHSISGSSKKISYCNGDSYPDVIPDPDCVCRVGVKVIPIIGGAFCIGNTVNPDFVEVYNSDLS